MTGVSVAWPQINFMAYYSSYISLSIHSFTQYLQIIPYMPILCSFEHIVVPNEDDCLNCMSPMRL